MQSSLRLHRAQHSAEAQGGTASDQGGRTSQAIGMRAEPIPGLSGLAQLPPADPTGLQSWRPGCGTGCCRGLPQGSSAGLPRCSPGRPACCRTLEAHLQMEGKPRRQAIERLIRQCKAWHVSRSREQAAFSNSQPEVGSREAYQRAQAGGGQADGWAVNQWHQDGFVCWVWWVV